MAERKIMTEEIRDQLPDDLNAVDHIGAYDFPDNSRRRIPGVIYSALALLCVVVWFVADNQDSALINKGICLPPSFLQSCPSSALPVAGA